MVVTSHGQFDGYFSRPQGRISLIINNASAAQILEQYRNFKTPSTP